MGEFAPVKQYVKKPKYVTTSDLYPPNNTPEFLNSMMDAELDSRLDKYNSRLKSKTRATNNRKTTLLDFAKTK